MDAYTINRQLNGLYRDLEAAHNQSETTVCRLFNADSRQEVIQLLTEEIDQLEAELNGFAPCDDDGMDYDALCFSQGISRYC